VGRWGALLPIAASVTCGAFRLLARARTVAAMIEKAVDALLQSFADAFNARDAKKLASLFTEDADLVNIVAMRMPGRSGIEAGHARHFAGNLANSRLAFTGRTVRMLKPDVAIVHASWHRDTVAGAEGPSMPPGDGIFTLVAVESGGEWRLTAAQNTQAMALPPRV
jgi:uncharacterized protein (TIGR02246 family)